MTNGRRDYSRELQWEHTKKPSRVKDRSQRNAARAAMKKKVGAAAIKGKDIGHKTAISRGGKNGLANLFVQSAGDNRSFRRTSSGAMMSETSKRERRK